MYVVEVVEVSIVPILDFHLIGVSLFQLQRLHRGAILEKIRNIIENKSRQRLARKVARLKRHEVGGSRESRESRKLVEIVSQSPTLGAGTVRSLSKSSALRCECRWKKICGQSRSGKVCRKDAVGLAGGWEVGQTLVVVEFGDPRRSSCHCTGNPWHSSPVFLYVSQPSSGFSRLGRDAVR